VTHGRLALHLAAPFVRSRCTNHPPVQGFVGNTDFDWFAFLRDRQPHEEVNFWQPSGGDAFRALAPGEPFFFRLKKPHHAIGGFGFFARHEVVSAKLAREAFGEEKRRILGASTGPASERPGVRAQGWGVAGPSVGSC